MTSAISSSLAGVAAAQQQLDVSAQSVATSDLPGISDSGDLVQGLVGASNAQVGQAVSLAMLRRAMDAEKSIIDIMA